MKDSNKRRQRPIRHEIDAPQYRSYEGCEGVAEHLPTCPAPKLLISIFQFHFDPFSVFEGTEIELLVHIASSLIRLTFCNPRAKEVKNQKRNAIRAKRASENYEANATGDTSPRQ